MNTGCHRQGRNLFVSELKALQSVSTGNVLFVKHGLQGRDLRFAVVLENILPDLSYVPGDQVPVESINNVNITTSINGESVMFCNTGGAGIKILTKGTSTNSAISGVANWALRFYVWRFDPNA